MKLYKLTNKARVRFAIGCALQRFDEPSYKAWALAWLDGSDRTYATAAADAAARVFIAIAKWAISGKPYPGKFS